MDLPDLTNVREFSFDFETFDPGLTTDGPGFVYDKAKVIGIAVYLDTGYNAYFPLRHKEGNVDYSQLKPWLIELFSSELRTSIAANIRYDNECLWSMGIDNKTWPVDIQILDALLDEEQQSYSLATLCKRYNLPEKLKDRMEEALRAGGYYLKGKADWTKLWKLPTKLVGEYAMYDAEATYKIYQLQKPRIVAEGLRQVAELESELIPVLHDMRVNGVPVDIARAEVENITLAAANKVMLDEIYETFPGINVFSPAQLGDAVLERGIIPSKTEKGHDSVSNEFLLSANDSLLNTIGKYRQQEKIRRDFIEGLILNGSYKGKVFPQWFQTRGSSFMSGDDTGGTRSGRIACSNPNLAQIPSRHPVLGPLVRSLFIPHAGDQWFKGDYSQQEPRISLHYAYKLKLTGTEAARQVYIDNPNTDYHTLTMNMVNAVSPTPINRTMAKTLNLGIAYGMGKKKLADALGLSQQKAQAIINSYHEGFPFMKELLDYAGDVAAAKGYVKTVLGRRRRFDLWEPPYFQRGKFPIRGKEAAIKVYGTVRQAHLHKAMNSIVQGTAAEQMKKTLVQLYKERIPVLITLYDEIGASIQSEKQAKLIKEIAEHIIEFSVPHVMDYKLMASWGGK
jgi:DNA polymerase I-like protein with 3'-5' exonuclease and polymerase domains